MSNKIVIIIGGLPEGMAVEWVDKTLISTDLTKGVEVADPAEGDNQVFRLNYGANAPIDLSIDEIVSKALSAYILSELNKLTLEERKRAMVKIFKSYQKHIQ